MLAHHPTAGGKCHRIFVYHKGGTQLHQRPPCAVPLFVRGCLLQLGLGFQEVGSGVLGEVGGGLAGHLLVGFPALVGGGLASLAIHHGCSHKPCRHAQAVPVRGVTITERTRSFAVEDVELLSSRSGGGVADDRLFGTVSLEVAGQRVSWGYDGVAAGDDRVPIHGFGVCRLRQAAKQFYLGILDTWN